MSWVEVFVCVKKNQVLLVVPLLSFRGPPASPCRVGAWRCPSRLPLSALLGGVPWLLFLFLFSVLSLLPCLSRSVWSCRSFPSGLVLCTRWFLFGLLLWLSLANVPLPGCLLVRVPWWWSCCLPCLVRGLSRSFFAVCPLGVCYVLCFFCFFFARSRFCVLCCCWLCCFCCGCFGSLLCCWW